MAYTKPHRYTKAELSKAQLADDLADIKAAERDAKAAEKRGDKKFAADLRAYADEVRAKISKRKRNPVRKKTTRKKKRSPAQRANDKRLGAMAKKRAAKKRPRKKKAVKKRATNPDKLKRFWKIFRMHNVSGFVDFWEAHQTGKRWGPNGIYFPTQTAAKRAIANIAGASGYSYGVAPDYLTASAVREEIDAGKR